jgi:hypothetical protein
MSIKNIKKLFNHKDYMLLSNKRVIYIVKILLPSFKVRCDLNDRYGKIGSLVENVYEDINSEQYFFILRNKQNIKLEDKFLYNIIFNNAKQEYSVYEHDEYYEKIEVK